MNSVITELGLPLQVVAEDGKEYTLDVWTPTSRDLENLWEQFGKYRIMFSDISVGRKDYFFQMMLAPGTIVLGVSTAGQAVGVVYITELRQFTSGDAHYFFWDKKTSGRQRVILTALRWAMDELRLHRVNIYIPYFAYSALHRVYKMRMRLEGKRREALLSEGKWIDMFYFGVLRSELTDEAVMRGYLDRTSTEASWFDLLNEDEELMKHIVHRRTP